MAYALRTWLRISHRRRRRVPADGDATPPPPDPWMLAAAGCAATGVYVPPGWWGRADDEELERLGGVQLVLATAVDDRIVLDCVVPLDPAGGVGVPYTLACRRHGCRRRHRVPRGLMRLAADGRLTEISLRRRAGVPVARVTGRGAVVELDLVSTSPPLDPFSE